MQVSRTPIITSLLFNNCTMVNYTNTVEINLDNT